VEGKPRSLPAYFAYTMAWFAYRCIPAIIWIKCMYVQRILEEARHQLARHYLNNCVLELNEAAYLLGCEDSNSFVRAFRTWEGVPPARWREKQRARAAA